MFFLLAACSKPPVPAPPFTEITLDFRHSSGAAGKYYMQEIMGSGVALLDFDSDGDLDIYLLQGLPGKGGNRLLRNDRGLSFSDATAAAGLTLDHYGMGAATGDFDCDGHVDLFVTGFGGNRLFRNTGKGTFQDVTADSPALRLPNLWSTSASFFDYDNDGLPDLFIAIYVDYSFAMDKQCQAPTGERDYCTPRAYRSIHSRLFHNEKGRYVDVTAKAGIDKAVGPAMGVVAFDANEDGYLDLLVANDSSANHLWLNQRDGTFREDALAAGVAYGEDGLAKAGMGVALGDYDNDGDEDLIVLNLMREGASLFQNTGHGGFFDLSKRSGVHNLTFLYTGFGVGWIDYDRDGILDLFLANGAVTRREEQRGKPYPFQERNLLLHNKPNAPFSEVPLPFASGVHRGAAFGDIDMDGDVDVVVNVNDGAAKLYLNTTPPAHWLAVDAPAGTRLELKAKGLPPQLRYARTDSSYLSASSSIVHFGLGSTERIESLTVSVPRQPPRTLYPQADTKIVVKPGTPRIQSGKP